MKTDKKVGLVEILDLIKSGSFPAQISKKYNIPKQNIAYFVGKLKRLGCIEKVGYGVWEYKKEVKKRPKGSIEGQNNKQIRGHAFIWKIQFIENYNWDQIVKNYKKSKLKFQRIFFNKVIRTIFNNRKIWLTDKGMVIYEPLDFYGGSSFSVKGTAVFEMDRLIKDLLKELNLKFRHYRFTTSREHYGIIKNELARQYNDKKEKLYIRGEDGTIWLWIDDSKSLGELENNKPRINRGVQNWFNDHKKHNFEVTPTFVLNAIAQNTKNLDYHAENMRTHVKAVQDLGIGVKNMSENFTEQIGILTKVIEGLAKKIK